MKNITKNKNRCPETEPILSATKNEEISSNCRDEFGNSSGYGFFYGEQGFPKKCVCGSHVRKYVSESIDNPGRPYFRCGASRKVGEDAMYEEVNELKVMVEKIEVKNMTSEMENMVEEVIECKKELNKLKIKNIVLVFCLCLLAFVIMYHIVFNHGE
ncbi:unnamed protein product [Microthlaspi erraticum]|uniref:Uncharacterized protein n=1 Tax=Microthlaspi erraticum TaxID=1685480 RepID=A0A6D2JWS5_9BRAS|nr:unnamed protein product [Microthlaspi erraticum]CAA7048841.1 unnamed protein product [Microthlaspi erraticum]CAA7052026.1 unnamed protein product [Microthlaspi erraticum]